MGILAEVGTFLWVRVGPGRRMTLFIEEVTRERHFDGGPGRLFLKDDGFSFKVG